MSYIDVPSIKAYLDIKASDDDGLLTTLAARAKAVIDQLTHRTFEASADTTRYFTVGIATDGQILYFDEDICAITTVKTNADNGTGGETVASTEYVTLPRNRTPYYGIRLLDSSTHEWEYTTDPENGVTVTGKWAYSATAPADIAQAALRLVGYMYRQKDAQVFDVIAQPDLGQMIVPQGLPADVRVTLDPYVRRVQL